MQGFECQIQVWALSQGALGSPGSRKEAGAALGTSEGHARQTEGVRPSAWVAGHMGSFMAKHAGRSYVPGGALGVRPAERGWAEI